MSERRGPKALELWCRRITEGYPGVNVQNMTTSWRDGLAFCAMIHHFRPDLIDFNSLNKDDVYGNNELAFRTAEQHLGIPALLDAEDMASCSVPDRLSILTYLSQFYQQFGGSSPSRVARSRTPESSSQQLTPVAESPTSKVTPRLGMRREPCVVCEMPVFLAEKLVISRLTYHRVCFRCARCQNQLTPCSYYETEDGQYCCETCPDEDAPSRSESLYDDSLALDAEQEEDENDDEKEREQQGKNKKVEEERQQQVEDIQGCSSTRSLSDEEKCVRKCQSEARNPDVTKHSSITHMKRLNFMSSHLQSASEEFKEQINHLKRSHESIALSNSCNDAKPPSPDDNDHCQNDEQNENKKTSKLHSMTVRTDNDDDDKTMNKFVNKSLEISTDSIHNRCLTATSHKYVDCKDEFKSQDTKEMLGVASSDEADVNQCLSLVQKRLKLFEKNFSVNNNDKKDCKNNGDYYSPSVSTFIEPDSLDNEVAFKRDELANLLIKQEKIQEIEETTAEGEEEEEEEEVIEKQEEEKQTEISKAKGIDQKNVLKDEDDDYPEELNPFRSDDDEENVDDKISKNYSVDKDASNLRKSLEIKPKSTNPFGSSGSSDENENEEDKNNVGKEIVAPKPAARTNLNKNNNTQAELPQQKRLLKAPRINLNPFWSDDEEEHDTDEDENEEERGRGRGGRREEEEISPRTPVPKPRKSKINELAGLNSKSDLSRDDIYASTSSLASSTSTSTHGSHYRKRKLAPPPPLPTSLPPTTISNEKSSVMLITSPDIKSKPNAQSSPIRTPKPRKSKPAPPPPPPACLFSSPLSTSEIMGSMETLTLSESSMNRSREKTDDSHNESWEDVKISKNEANRSKQSMSALSRSCESNEYLYHDKSIKGKWKRKKAPAPAIPTPQRRKIKVLSMKDVRRELSEIEMQQQGLEKQGVRLEQLIREKCEPDTSTGGGGDVSTGQDDESSLSMDADELVLELFALVNEKNELFRRQAELMLLKRQHRLEEEHADIEYQIRCLMCQPEATKTDFDKQREEALIQRLVEIVERRSEIVECLEMDRRREVEEDKSINMHMELYTAKNKGGNRSDTDEQTKVHKNKKIKFKEKIKEKHFKKSHYKKDADKDVDETEVKLKRQNKRKWF